MAQDRERKNLDLELKEVSADGTFEGLASVYDVTDYQSDIVERGAFTKTIKERHGTVPLLWQHNPEKPIGRLTIADGDKGLAAKGTILLSDDVPDGKMAYALLKAGVVKSLSIGFRVVKSKMDDAIRRIKEVELFEVSLVTIPANRFALVNSVKAAGGARGKDFDSELELVQLADACYQHMSALRTAIYTVIYDPNNEQKLESVASSIDQFKESLFAFLPRYLELLANQPQHYSADVAIEKWSSMPDQVRDRVAEWCTKFLKHSSTPAKGAAEAAGGAISVEPGSEPLHSIVEKIKNFQLMK